MSAGRSERAGERGAVLVFVVLLMLALVALGHGALAISLGEEAASRAAARHLMARAAAEGAASVAIRQPWAAWMDSVPVGSSRPMSALSLGRADAAATAQRLTRESWLVEGSGGLPGRAVVRSARLAWAPDPLERIKALPGVLNSAAGAPSIVAGSVDAGTPAQAAPPLDPADCSPWQAQLAAHYLGSRLAVTGVIADTVGGPGLGLLGFSSLLGSADVFVTGTGTPAPAQTLGVCAVDAPWGWGDPDQRSGPCGSHLPLRASLGDLIVVGGAGQGMLVVEGDLTLTAGARYYGLVVVSGSLRLETAASLDGMAIALAGIYVEAGAQARGSACWAVRSLAAQRASLGRLIPVGRAGAIGPL